MSKLTIPEQDALIERYKTRKDIRNANEYLTDLLLAWVIDVVPNYAEFHASGAIGHFGISPTIDFMERMGNQGLTEEQIIQALRNGERTLDYMPPEILASVYDRIQRMSTYLRRTPPGTFKYACAIYEAFGRVVRGQFIQQYGYPPEQYETQHGKITGEESEKAFQPTPHQPELF